MMGPSHALSGAAVWLAGSWALDHFAGYEQSPLAIAVGTAVCAASGSATETRNTPDGCAAATPDARSWRCCC